ncbi:MAG: type II methionyl aminopeptidase [Methanomassiliicoccaceae archaeon]|nr:type II methionyl aminopeptidase [Methanomassiliicoccaceae archaeon]MCL2148395.1 type II methionyl aminopeptidase [Methanomassiliicoccaceae archaeon]
MLTAEELSMLRKAGETAAAARSLGMDMVREGVKLYDVAQEVEGYIRGKGCGLAFPCNISVNEIAAHYTPSVNDKSVFEAGDVVKVDCGAEVGGFVGDTAGTVEVGTKRHTALIEASKRARDTVAEIVGAGTPICEIGRVVEMCMHQGGFKPIRNLCGHEIKPYNLHAGVSIPNYHNGDSDKLTSGMVVAIEPFATNGEGIVLNGPLGNIVRIQRERKLADPKAQEFFDYAKGEFKTFPFCARSCDFPDAERHVRTLIRHGVLTGYPQFIEARKGMVSQHEHTFYIAGERAEVTTLP